MGGGLFTIGIQTPYSKGVGLLIALEEIRAATAVVVAAAVVEFFNHPVHRKIFD